MAHGGAEDKGMTQKLPKLALLAGSAVALAFPQGAHAALIFTAEVGGQTFHVEDNDANDTDADTGVLRIADQTVAGINLRGSIQSSRKDDNGLNVLNSSALSVRNATNSPLTIRLAVSDTDFPGTSTSAFTSASGTFENSDGSTITLNWFVDALNSQGAETISDTPGELIDSFNFTAAGLASSFSHDDDNIPTNLAGPYSMTLAFEYTLPVGGALISRGATVLQDVEAVAEPGALGLLGLGLLAIGLRRRRRA
jgi:hypothetical protein